MAGALLHSLVGGSRQACAPPGIPGKRRARGTTLVSSTQRRQIPQEPTATTINNDRVTVYAALCHRHELHTGVERRRGKKCDTY